MPSAFVPYDPANEVYSKLLYCVAAFVVRFTAHPQEMTRSNPPEISTTDAPDAGAVRSIGSAITAAADPSGVAITTPAVLNQPTVMSETAANSVPGIASYGNTSTIADGLARSPANQRVLSATTKQPFCAGTTSVTEFSNGIQFATGR